jgi:hypothetical protein
VNVNEYRWSVSSACDLNARVVDVTVWGMSSSFVHVTVVPALTVIWGGLKVKLAILTLLSAARAGVIANGTKMAAASAKRANNLVMSFTSFVGCGHA